MYYWYLTNIVLGVPQGSLQSPVLFQSCNYCLGPGQSIPVHITAGSRAASTPEYTEVDFQQGELDVTLPKAAQTLSE